MSARPFGRPGGDNEGAFGAGADEVFDAGGVFGGPQGTATTTGDRQGGSARPIRR